ncbi:MAG TPA: IS1595 family transposase [Ktedonobacteraceae bacterium]
MRHADQVRCADPGWNVYKEAGKSFASHETVEHGKGEYVRGKAHINTAEGYFSQLKRSIDGTHHHVSAHHLHRYLNEFDYRYNTRKITGSEPTQQAIQQTTGKRLMYQHRYFPWYIIEQTAPNSKV